MSDESRRKRRQQQTRETIVRAFSQLMLERHYGAITVAEVVVRADVGRSTFYEHFPTKLDLLRAALAMPFTPLAEAVTESAPGLLYWVHHFRENQALARVLFAEPTRRVLYRTLADLIEARLPAGLSLPGGIVAAQVAAAQMALLEPWTLGQSALPAEAVALAMQKSSRALVAAAL